MDEDRTVDTLRDEVGLEIERMLAIDPAPGLKVQVRARIDRERMRALGVRWRLASVGALAVAVVMVLVVFRPQREPERASPTQEVIAIPASEPSPTAAAAEQTLSHPERTAPPRQIVDGRRGRVQSKARAAVSAVLVSPDERTHLRRLIANLRQGQIDPSVLDNAQSTAGPLEPLKEVTIEPIAIEPLARLELLEGERQ